MNNDLLQVIKEDAFDHRLLKTLLQREHREVQQCHTRLTFLPQP
jgi:hypothetical protein